jgi:hypothetical protein
MDENLGKWMNKPGQRVSTWMEDESYEVPLDEKRVPGTDGTMYVCMPGNAAVLGGCETLLITAIFGALKNQGRKFQRETSVKEPPGFVKAMPVAGRVSKM